MFDLAVVLPCLNEADNLCWLLPRIHEVLRGIDAHSAVYVIDGGSTDNTTTVAHEMGAKVIIQQGEGYGGAIKTAIADVPARYLLTLDADFSHHPAFIKYLYARRGDAEIIIASRYAAQGHAEMPWLRKMLSITLNFVFQMLLGLKVRDLSSGFRLYHRNAVRHLQLTYDTYAVLQEILVKAYCAGYRVVEEPFHYQPRRHGSSHARVVQFGVVYMKALYALWLLRKSSECADYDTRAFFSVMPFLRRRQRRRYRIMLELLDDNARALHTGCGSTQLLNGAPHIIGMDTRRNTLRFMRRPGRSLINGSTEALPFSDNAFDTIIASRFIGPASRDQLELPEIYRCLAMDGELIIGMSCRGRWPWLVTGKGYTLIDPADYAEGRVAYYSFDALKKQLEDGGFDVVMHRYIPGGELILKARKKRRL